MNINGEKKRLGFFGGSFNPPTIAHIELAMQALKEFELNQVIFVPVSDQYSKTGLVSAKHRYEMLKRICDGQKLEVSDIELKINHKLYAADIFQIIYEKYQEDEVFFLIGSDNLKKISKWKKSDELVKNYQYIILERKDNVQKIINSNELLLKYKEHFNILKTKNYHQQISSTIARSNFNSQKEIKSLVPEAVIHYMNENKLYC